MKYSIKIHKVPKETEEIEEDSGLIGKTLYFHDNDHMSTSGINIQKGVVIKTTAKFCTLELSDGINTKRKTKRLLFDTEDDAKLYLVKRVDNFIYEQFNSNIMGMSKLFSEMIDKYPEKFV